jgi:hypothetical protein
MLLLLFSLLVSSLVLLAVFGPSLRTYPVKVLTLYKKWSVFMLRIRGHTPASHAEQRVVTGQAWDQFCDSLKAAGASLHGPGCPKDAFNQAEGLRYLSRLARVALESWVECSDPTAPQLVSLANGLRTCPVKLGSDNPDNLYENAHLSNKYVYRVTGNTGTVKYLGLGIQAGSYGKPGGLQTVDYRERHELKLNDDSTIELFVSTEANKPPGCVNWLKMVESPAEHLLIVRNTFERRDLETAATLKIERFGEVTRPQNVTCEGLTNALDTAGMFVSGVSLMFTFWAWGFQKHVNELPLFDQEKSNKAGGDPHIRYYHSYWSLKPDEALVIDAEPPACHTWNFQLNNHWMESLDYRYYNVHVNKGTARYRPGGGVCVIVAHEDPKIPEANWINTASHLEGTMTWRWIHPRTADGTELMVDGLPAPRPRVVKLADYKRCVD